MSRRRPPRKGAYGLTCDLSSFPVDGQPTLRLLVYTRATPADVERAWAWSARESAAEGSRARAGRHCGSLRRPARCDSIEEGERIVSVVQLRASTRIEDSYHDCQTVGR